MSSLVELNGIEPSTYALRTRKNRVFVSFQSVSEFFNFLANYAFQQVFFVLFSAYMVAYRFRVSRPRS